MKVMVITKATSDSENGIPPEPGLMTAMIQFNKELGESGILLAADGLMPSSQGKRVDFTQHSHTVTDGPFAETKELIAGFWIWEVRSIDEAVAWVKRCPLPAGSAIEIRPLFDAADFELTPEQRAVVDSIPSGTIRASGQG